MIDCIINLIVFFRNTEASKFWHAWRKTLPLVNLVANFAETISCFTIRKILYARLVVQERHETRRDDTDNDKQERLLRNKVVWLL